MTNNRLGGGFNGATETPEQYVPATGILGRNDGSGPKGGDGIIAKGPQKGLQGFACFVLDGPDWGLYKAETKINPPRFTRDQITALVNNALERKLALSFNLLMYEDGSVSPESLDMMKYVRTIVRRK